MVLSTRSKIRLRNFLQIFSPSISEFYLLLRTSFLPSWSKIYSLSYSTKSDLDTLCRQYSIKQVVLTDLLSKRRINIYNLQVTIRIYYKKAFYLATLFFNYNLSVRPSVRPQALIVNLGNFLIGMVISKSFRYNINIFTTL